VWRFGDRPEDGEAWLANPEMFHAYVDFQVPGSAVWHRLVVCSDRWVEGQFSEAIWAFLPAMIVVRVGPAAEMRSRVDEALRSGWRLFARDATAFPEDYEPIDW
jgi:hypothetical protein